MIRQGLLWATLIGLWVYGTAQQSASLDFFSLGGRFEIDYNKDGREDYASDFVEGGVSEEHITRRLDTEIKYGGAASQRIQLQRSNGAAGRYVIYESVDFNASIKPEVGEPLLVRVAFRAQSFQNATYRVYVRTGSRTVLLLPPSNQPTADWQLLSAVVPVELDSSGQPRFSLNIEITANEGAAQGAIWIDEAQALSTRTIMRANTLPNGLKLAIVNANYSDPYQNLTKPIGLLIGSIDHQMVLRRHYPYTLGAPYVFWGGAQRNTSTLHSSELYGYEDLDQNHPDWFLLDSNGQRIGTADYHYVDVGRPEVRERAWQKLRDFLNRSGRPLLVYTDDVHLRLGGVAQNYPTRDSWGVAAAGWFAYVGSRLRSEFGATFIPNTAWAPGFWLRGLNGNPDPPGVGVLEYIGGFLIEHAFIHARSNGRISVGQYGTVSGNLGLGSWWGAMRHQVRLATEYPDKIVILHPTYILNLPDTQQKLRFAIAGCLIVQHENTYVEIEPRYSGTQYPEGYYPPELFVPLGRWTENFRILNGDIITGGLFVRNYENGIVVWNPCHDRDFTFTVPRDLYDWDRNLIRAGTVVQIPRQTGHVFYSAPEITVELSPQNTEVLPGQTVQFTVTYRNRGTAPGTNVRIAVPLPQGMTLVGSNPQARLENGEVVWIVPSVPIGGQGTLQFTVRVE